MVCYHRLLKQEKRSLRLRVYGYELEYVFDAASPGTSPTETKLTINSATSDFAQGALCMMLDI